MWGSGDLVRGGWGWGGGGSSKQILFDQIRQQSALLVSLQYGLGISFDKMPKTAKEIIQNAFALLLRN